MLSGRTSRAARCIFPVFCNSLANKTVVAAVNECKIAAVSVVYARKVVVDACCNK